jgi:hypothetical protein
MPKSLSEELLHLAAMTRAVRQACLLRLSQELERSKPPGAGASLDLEAPWGFRRGVGQGGNRLESRQAMIGPKGGS